MKVPKILKDQLNFLLDVVRRDKLDYKVFWADCPEGRYQIVIRKEPTKAEKGEE